MRFRFPIYYETPTGMSGGAGGPAGTPAPQPGAPGQGGDGFRQTYFANVPDEHWSLMEPHLGNVNKHVTQLEQRYAPFKSYTPEAVQGLAAFVQAFDQDPRGQWIQLAHVLQQEGKIDPDVDLDHLAMLIAGEDPDDSPGPELPGDPNGAGLPPEVIQTLQAMQARIDELEGSVQQDRQSIQERREDRALELQMNHIKGELQKAGFPEDFLSDQFLLGQYIAHQGNAGSVIQSLSNQRNALLKGLVPGQGNAGRRDLDTSAGVPSTGRQRPGSNRRGMFSGVSAAAEQFISKADKEG